VIIDRHKISLIFDLSENLVISPGGAPHLPPTISLIEPHPKIIHSSSYATSIPTILSSITSHRLNPSKPIRIAVIGGGQSSAEVTLDLYNRMNAIPIVGEGYQHEVEMIIAKGSIKPSDDSPFSNEIFDPNGKRNTSILLRKLTWNKQQRIEYSACLPRERETPLSRSSQAQIMEWSIH
jgi:lysine/ornithine N-monooxygenase